MHRTPHRPQESPETCYHGNHETHGHAVTTVTTVLMMSDECFISLPVGVDEMLVLSQRVDLLDSC